MPTDLPWAMARLRERLTAHAAAARQGAAYASYGLGRMGAPLGDYAWVAEQVARAEAEAYELALAELDAWVAVATPATPQES